MGHSLLCAARVLLVPLLHVFLAVNLVRARLALGFLGRIGFICWKSYKEKDVSQASRGGTAEEQEARLAGRAEANANGRPHQVRRQGFATHIWTRSRRRIRRDEVSRTEATRDETKMGKDYHAPFLTRVVLMLAAFVAALVFVSGDV
jgi:hypothetical protein